MDQAGGPKDDLSDLGGGSGSQNRAEGLAELLKGGSGGNATPGNTGSNTPPAGGAPKPAATGAPKSSPAGPKRGARRGPSASTRKRPNVTIPVSEALYRRFERAKNKDNLTSSVLVLKAITHCHDGDLANLAKLVEDSKVITKSGVGGDLFPEDDAEVKYLGWGHRQLQFTPTRPQVEVLDNLTDDLGAESRTWIVAVLNEFLPGRKERRPGAAGSDDSASEAEKVSVDA